MSYAGNSDSATTGFCPAPPPPPPPPPTPGQLPAVRINTAEAPRPRRPQNNSDPYEPPAAIQNAMMTKDKKPFTYTPGMGGKLDLSQIRSPRMARRVAKNANDEGIEGPPKSAIESKPTSSNLPANIYVQPQVAVPVFPTNLPVQPSVNRTQSTHVNRVPNLNVSNSQNEPPRNVQGRNEGKVTPITIVPSIPSSPQSPTSPPQVTLAKAPTPWLQNKPKQQEELPEWAKRASANASRPIEVQSTSFNDNSNAANNVFQPPQQTQMQSFAQPQNTQSSVNQRQQDRVVPVRIEDRPSVFSVKNEPGHHQFKQSPNQQQRWGQPQPQQQYIQQQPQQHNPQSGGTRIIPIMVEDNNGQHSPQGGRTIPVDVQGSKIIVQRGGPPVAANQLEPGPVQSRSFRVLQKITDTDSDTDVDTNSEQIRKLQLTEDDKVLMNKFKDQVDGENYLHQEEDPRYRGAAIPSRAFRFLQNMTDSGEVPSTSNAPRPASAINKKQNRNSKSFEEAQANLPPSEQQVQEPKKYMGSAIPSRSFRILQAMTSPENIAPQENRQQENFTSRTENSVTGNQQSGVFFPPNCPPSPYWNPENGWWGYYPVQYAAQNGPNGIPPSTPAAAASPSPLNVSYNPYAYCGYGADPNSYYYPIYDQNYAQNYNNQNQINDQNYQIHGYLPVNMYPHHMADQSYHEELRNWYENNNNNNTNDNGVDNYARDDYHDADDKVRSKENFGVEDKEEEELVKEETKPIINVNEVSTVTKEPTKNNSKFLTVPKWTKPTDRAKTAVTKENDKQKVSDDSKTEETNSDSDSDSDSSDSDSDSSSDSETSEDSSESSSSTSDNESTSEYQAYVNEIKVPPQAVATRPSCLQLEPAKSQSDKDCEKSFSGETISEDAYEHSSKLSSDKLSCSDCDSDADDEYQIESLNNDCILPHQLSVIYEDVEQTETESESRKLDSVMEVINEKTEVNDCENFYETGDPPDDNDDTTVSVSLPLRFKFSVSANNEDVTTVIVGDSTVRTGSKFDNEETVNNECTEPDDNNDVHVNFNIKKNNNTSVDFTLKKNKSSVNDESNFDTEFTLTNEEETRVNLREKKEESLKAKINIDEIIIATEETDENANLKKNDVKNVECNENVETEFTIRRKKTDVIKHVWKKDLDLEERKETETSVKNGEPSESTVTEYTVRNQTINSNGSGYDSEYEVTSSKTEMDENIQKEIIEQESLKIKERESVRTEFGVKKIHKPDENNTEDESAEDKNLDFTNVANFNTAKRILSVQNSRDETDDEDSGVTSDMSRIISEVDTDSECASIRRMNKYQRTQTHSRLFKLLNDDAVLAEEDQDNSSEEFYSPGRREHLSLPLKANVFNYDENYYSNYSSGITSPDYSPLCEQSWRRIHEGRSLESENSCSSVTTPNECVDNMGNEMSINNFPAAVFGSMVTTNAGKPAPNDDPYFQTWKKVVSPVEFDYDILPSIAFKKLKNGIANFNGKTNRINVLCPRIKSSKNVPQALLQSKEEKSLRKATAASSIPFLSTISSLKNGHC